MKKSSKKAGGAGIRAWEDDPLSGAHPIDRPLPDLSAAPLPLKIAGKKPAAKAYEPGSPGFRYWTAAEALRRGADFWGGLLPKGSSWQGGGALSVRLDAGEDLNAYYDRDSLSFFHANVKAGVSYSGESPDIVCHELGHAVLDAIRPELWDVMADEVAAFHESFGDISALLCALQLPSMRQAILKDTAGKLYRTSRLSRLAEQLGAGIRESFPDAAEPDCLRNAVNSHFYKAPNELPPSGPASRLSSEPHSFSRVFTAGFFEALSGMFKQSPNPTSATLLKVTQDAGRLLVAAVKSAPIVPDYYSQVAAHMVAADESDSGGKYGSVLRSAFVRRGILSLESPAAIAPLSKAARSMTAAAPGGVKSMKLDGQAYGMGGMTLVVEAAGEEKRFGVAPSGVDQTRTAPPRRADDASRNFVSYLFRRGRVDLKQHGMRGERVSHPFARKTHELVANKSQTEMQVVRLTFDCGLDAD
jgi:hypothetical protein